MVRPVDRVQVLRCHILEHPESNASRRPAAATGMTGAAHCGSPSSLIEAFRFAFLTSV
jgi:hypothetical protein